MHWPTELFFLASANLVNQKWRPPWFTSPIIRPLIWTFAIFDLYPTFVSFSSPLHVSEILPERFVNSHHVLALPPVYCLFLDLCAILAHTTLDLNIRHFLPLPDFCKRYFLDLHVLMKSCQKDLLTAVTFLRLLLLFSWSSCYSSCSYDPWAGCVYISRDEIRNGYSGSVQVRRRSPPGCHGFVCRNWRSIPDFTRVERSNSVCGRHHAWSLLEDRSSDPSPQVLSSLDAVRRDSLTVVERRCSTLAPRHRHIENRQRKMFVGFLLAIWIHEPGTCFMLSQAGVGKHHIGRLTRLAGTTSTLSATRRSPDPNRPTRRAFF